MTKRFGFSVATDNIRATPPISKASLDACILRSVRQHPAGVPDVTVVGYHEMQGRRLDDLYAGPKGTSARLYPHWHADQGPKGDQARTAWGYRTEASVDNTHPLWRYRGSFSRQLSHSTTLTEKILVPSGNRWARVLFLEHVDQGAVAAFVGLHTVAHVNVGGHFGYTGKGPKSLLKLRGKMANPAIQTYKESMANLEALLKELNGAGFLTVALGDWNFGALADYQANMAGKGEFYAPRQVMTRCGMKMIYGDRNGLPLHGRQIDYIAAGPGVDFRKGFSVSNKGTDHPLVYAYLNATVPDGYDPQHVNLLP